MSQGKLNTQVNRKTNKFGSYIRWGLAGGLILTAWGLSLTGLSSASGISFSGSATSAEAMVYKEECGACHIAYPSRLLPAASWSEMMMSLDDHFGENAEVSAEVGRTLNAYLADNAGKPGRGMLKRLRGEAPLRISELPYFIHEHDEIPNRVVTGNAEVMSFSHCGACHKGAEDGDFDEHSVSIPGYGRWDD